MKTYSSRPRHEKVAAVSCNLCGGGNYTPYITLKNCTFVRCTGCGLVFQNPQPVFEDLRERYQKEYFDYELHNEKNFFNLMLLGLRDIGFHKTFLKNFTQKTFLDIGCATGMLLSYMKQLGYRVQGVEICRESSLYGMKKREVPIFPGTIEQADLPPNSFSLIHFSHLIEHVPDPVSFLEEVRRLLAPQGYAVITTPNCRGMQARLFKGAWRSAIPDHLFLFSKSTFKRLLTKCGFSIIKVVTWGGLAAGTAPVWLKRPVDFLAKKWGFGDVMLFLVKRRESP